uniref:TCDD inducible poly(ADP-ribose) polymerase n=1 Tax=Gopherus agassizii TaxID=38772 RepID=A0A452IBS2_9SAUR
MSYTSLNTLHRHYYLSPPSLPMVGPILPCFSQWQSLFLPSQTAAPNPHPTHWWCPRSSLAVLYTHLSPNHGAHPPQWQCPIPHPPQKQHPTPNSTVHPPLTGSAHSPIPHSLAVPISHSLAVPISHPLTGSAQSPILPNSNIQPPSPNSTVHPPLTGSAHSPIPHSLAVPIPHSLGLIKMAEKPKRPHLGLAQYPLLLTLEPEGHGLGGQVLELAGPEEVHVHQKDGILICDDFLLGQCLEGERCPHHHTPNPFHWQMRRKADGVWLSIGTLAQQHLENLYCSTSRHDVQLIDKAGSSWTLNLNSMDLKPSQLYDCVRRLSNSSDPSRCMARRNVAEWCPVTSSLCAQPVRWELLAAFEKGMWNHRNVRTGFTRRILHCPVFRPPWRLAPRLRTGPGATLSSPSTVPGEDQVAPAERAYKTTCTLFHKTLAEDKVLVLAIYRVRNDYLWQKYCGQKKFMAHSRPRAVRCCLERHLFHGTTASKVQPICEINFDPRVSGENGEAYGRGSYFAVDASYSHSYAKVDEASLCHMFLAKVLVGRSVRGNPVFRRPPLAHDGLLYDSCMDYAKKPQIFVIFDSCQCYPYFLIRYKLLSEPVAVDS